MTRTTRDCQGWGYIAEWVTQKESTNTRYGGKQNGAKDGKISKWLIKGGRMGLEVGNKESFVCYVFREVCMRADYAHSRHDVSVCIGN